VEFVEGAARRGQVRPHLAGRRLAIAALQGADDAFVLGMGDCETAEPEIGRAHV
jgi:hypothetical protein